MIDQVKEPFTYSKLKKHIFSKFAALVNLTYSTTNPTAGSFFFDVTIITILYVSILFQQGVTQYWVCDHVQTIVNCIQYFNLTVLYTDPIIELTIQAVALSFMGVFTLVNVLIFVLPTTQKSLAVVLVQCARLMRLVSVPLFNVVVCNILNTNTNLNNFGYITTPLLALMFVISFVLMSLMIRFYYSPLPKTNTYLKLNTDYQIYSFWTNFAKVLLYHYQGVTLGFITSVLFIDVVKLMTIRGMQKDSINCSVRIPSFVSATTCLIILTNQIIPNSGAGLFNIWILAVVGIFLNSILKWNNVSYSREDMILDCALIDEKNLVLVSQRFLQLDDWTTLGSEGITYYLDLLCLHINRCSSDTCQFKGSRNEIQKLNSKVVEENPSKLRYHVINLLLQLLYNKGQTSDAICCQYKIFCYCTHQSDYKVLNQTFSGNICYQYIGEIINQKIRKHTHNEDSNITIDNYQLNKTQLFGEFYRVLTSLKAFLTELKTKKPIIDVLMQHGYDSYTGIDNLKRLFMRILNSEFFDLKLVEVYAQFLTNVLREKDTCDYVCKISKQKWDISNSNFQLVDSSIASLHIDPDQDKIFNMNAEAIKILKFHRMDIYEKQVCNLLHPYNLEAGLRSLFTKIVEKRYFCLVKDGSKQFVPTMLNGRVMSTPSNKEMNIIEIECLNNLKEEAFILINSKDQFVEAHPKTLCWDRNARSTNVEQIFTKCLAGQIHHVRTSGFANIQRDWVHLHVQLIQTIHSQYSCIRIKIKKNARPVAQNISCFKINKQGTFQFSPVLNPDNLTLVVQGSVSREVHLANEAVVEFNFQQRVRKSLIQHFVVRERFAQGIKSYRLRGDMIYNIQLQQSEQKAVDHDDVGFESGKENNRYESVSKIRLYYIAIIVVALVYSITHIGSIFVKLGVLREMSANNQIQGIMMFEIRFQRMFGVLRDAKLNVKYNTNTTWNQQIFTLFNGIQSLQGSLKFSEDLLTMTFRNTTYNTFLDELCNVLLTHMYGMASRNSTEGFEQLNQLSIDLIDPNIDKEKRRVADDLDWDLAKYKAINIMIIAIHSALIVVMLVLIILVNTKIKDEKVALFQKWRRYTDAEIQSLIDSFNFFQTLVELAQRNEDIDVFDTLKQTRHYKKRQYLKELSKANDRANLYWGLLAIFFLSLGIFIHGYSINTAYQQSSTISNTFKFKYQLISSYVETVKYSKFNNTVGPVSTIAVGQIINDINVLLPKAHIEPELKLALIQYLYQDHCNQVIQMVPQVVNCKAFLKGYPDNSPFDTGYLFDMSLLTFSIVNKITFLYPCSGIIGFAYSVIMVDFLGSLGEGRVKMMDMYYNNEVGYSMTSVMLCLGCWMALAVVFFSNMAELRKAQKIGELLNNHKQSLKKAGYVGLPEQDNQDDIYWQT